MARRKVASDGFRVINERIEMVPIDSLRPSPENVNQGDLGVVIDSVGRHGFYGCIVAQKSTGHIIAGEFRWRAAQHHGAKEVPVAFVDVDDAEARRMRLVDNRSTRLGMDDPAALARLLQELACDGGLEGTGFDAEALDNLLQDLAGPNNLEDHWKGMPEYSRIDLLSGPHVLVRFKNTDDLKSFAELVGQPILETTRTIWYPAAEIDHTGDLRYVSDQ